MLSNKPMRILTKPYIDCNESNVVNEPAPAMRGNTKGTIVEAPVGPLLRKISTSSTISTAMRKSTIEPPIANEHTSTWNKPNIDDPKKRNAKNIMSESNAALVGLISRPF